MRSTAIFIAGLLIALASVLVGAWWAPFTVGLAMGIAEPQPRRAVPLGAVMGLLAWALPLGTAHLRYGLGPSAASLAAIMGFGRQGAIPLVLTMVVGLLLGLTGAWLGSAAKKVVSPTAR